MQPQLKVKDDYQACKNNIEIERTMFVTDNNLAPEVEGATEVLVAGVTGKDCTEEAESG